MEENIKTKRMRKVSSWMTDAVEAINNEDEILAGKRIVLKIIRYMENNHMSQKDLAENSTFHHSILINFFMDKIATLKFRQLSDMENSRSETNRSAGCDYKKQDAPVVLYAVNNYSYRVCDVGKYSYNHVFTQQFRHNN